MSNYNLQTVGGHSFYTVASAIQKYVRRGDEHKALYWFSELFISGFDAYAWKRIKVMVSEDIGLANPDLPAQIHSLHQTYLEMKKEKNKHSPEKLPFIHAVLLLVRSPKSRIVDNLLCQYFDLRENLEVPAFDDYVYCLHTIEGKKKGRGNRHFYEDAAKITNDIMPEEYEVRDRVASQYYKRDADKKSSQQEPIQQKPPKAAELFD
jgi:replication-associated recombination protein RarA